MADVEPSSPPASDPTSAAPKKMKPARKKPSKGTSATCAPSSTTPANGASAQQQKQRDKEFSAHKSHILANLQANACDLSPKGSVDVKCLPVMAVLNTHGDYVTTSSCSGRIALFHHVAHGEAADADLESASTPKPRMKRGEDAALGWVLVKHGMLRPAEMALVVQFLCGVAATPDEVALDAAQMEQHVAHMTVLCGCDDSGADAASPLAGMYAGEVEGALANSVEALAVPTRGTVSLKMEPFVMHVECRTMEAAKRLLSAAVSDSGYRNSGVVPPGKKIMCGIRGAAGLGMEVPVVVHGVNHVAQQRAYVWALLGLANEKMEANERKIKLLEASVAARVQPA
ncbi:Methyltransferase TYW3 [Novymonas esmeraldas]|uniref:tRNA(Phe) 7-[(3-amino-3-carboxypropyl)-4-demethylwyosine(37)-N(4)]-methyltransferase n=1 Tax=Novymonas esmeraldas TaxID=1808958 RepID=A0AAW0EVE9_9TRYP